MTSRDVESVDSWATANNLELLHDRKAVASFFSHRRNFGANPELGFASIGHDNRLLDRLLGKFQRSQVTKPTFSLNATEAQNSCLQQSGQALEHSQG